MSQSNTCTNCGAKCLMMVRTGTGICSENCEKELKQKQFDRETYDTVRKELAEAERRFPISA